VVPTVRQATCQDGHGDQHLFWSGPSVVAVLVAAVAEPPVSWEDHPTVAQEDARAGDLHLVISRWCGCGAPPLSASSQLADSRLAMVEDVAVVSGEDHHAPGFSSGIEKPPERP
jgi:hypothetical protein